MKNKKTEGNCNDLKFLPENPDEKEFLLHWLTGDKETVSGPDIATACNNAGIGAGALAALDYWKEIIV